MLYTLRRPLEMNLKKIIFILIGLAGSLALCGRELALPSIPSELRTAPLRAAWLLEHFWDNMDFSDSAAVADREFMGRNFADFMSVMPVADSCARRRAVEVMVGRASESRFAANELSLLTEGYLLDRRSPVADDEVYLLFADAMLAADYPRREAIEFMRRMTAQCRPGTEAPDFEFTARDGRHGRMSDYRGRQVLLLFYSPDCNECRAEIAQLKADTTLTAAIASGQTVVLAVYGGSDERIWRAGQILPDEWIDAISPDIDELYPVDGLPCRFRITPQGILE